MPFFPSFYTIRYISWSPNVFLMQFPDVSSLLDVLLMVTNCSSNPEWQSALRDNNAPPAPLHHWALSSGIIRQVMEGRAALGHTRLNTLFCGLRCIKNVFLFYFKEGETQPTLGIEWIQMRKFGALTHRSEVMRLFRMNKMDNKIGDEAFSIWAPLCLNGTELPFYLLSAPCLRLSFSLTFPSFPLNPPTSISYQISTEAWRSCLQRQQEEPESEDLSKTYRSWIQS